MSTHDYHKLEMLALTLWRATVFFLELIVQFFFACSYAIFLLIESDCYQSITRRPHLSNHQNLLSFDQKNPMARKKDESHTISRA